MNLQLDSYTLSSLILTLAVLMGYINYRFIKMQTTIAIMSGSLILSLILLIASHLGISQISVQAERWLIRTDFHDLLLHGMLSFLLFAGALTVDINTLKQRKWEITVLSAASTVASAIIVGVVFYYLLAFFGIHMNFVLCFLFGALISPTDPIAVLATFKEIGAPKDLEVCVAGESLFNDGVGIVMFVTLYQLAFEGHHDVTAWQVALLFLQQAIGGMLFGALIGWLAVKLIATIKDPKVVILITLAIVTGAYSVALSLSISGPLAMVVAGLMVGSHVHRTPERIKFHASLDMFWEIIDEILNAVLFLLIGFELLVLHTETAYLILAILAIPILLLIRWVTVAVPIRFFPHWNGRKINTINILTWGGLRGGLAVALALSLPITPQRSLIMAMTYAIVAFAVIVQGLTIKKLLPTADPSTQ